MSKNAAKWVVSPTIKMSDRPGTVSVEPNKSNNAGVLTLRMFVGSPREQSFTPKGEKEAVRWTTVGTIDLDASFEVNGVECRLVAVKKFGRLSSLEVRVVGGSSSEAAADTALQF